MSDPDILSATQVMIDHVWRELSDEISSLDSRVSKLSTLVERAETAGGVPAYALASAPTNATGGMSDGTEHIDLAWIKDGRKSGEGAGLGTGVLAIFDSAANAWKNVDGYAAVTT